jgi:hypothetical protein
MNDNIHEITTTMGKKFDTKTSEVIHGKIRSHLNCPSRIKTVGYLQQIQMKMSIHS